MYSISVEKFIKDMDLEIIYTPEKTDIKIVKSDLNRPGLQLAGYFDYFAYERLQIIGSTEWNYLSTLDIETRKERLNKLFSYPFPALIITRNQQVFPEMLKCAEKHNRTIVRTKLATTKFTSKLVNYLEDILAPQTTIHGVLVDVYGIGILLLGKSGVGKSETALELIKRGHRLVADDAVQIKRVEEGVLKGKAPDLIRHFLEIRGVGILDIKRLYGVGAVRNAKRIDVVIELEIWDDKKEYDRLGLNEEYAEILNTKVPKIIIPVKPGRNLAMIVEVAAKNHRQKKMGYNAAEELNKKLVEQMNIKNTTGSVENVDLFELD
ncbi:HPr(Ser) kinase/phosphatase [Caldisalinibacter kiritimatiensis]|uniref:HPr kinase/phosphorylase n=1 Tax=Caldisalinibacter kiritimatiensis TaxID=1304284 RepID=R1ATI5_9FIRM|nr:HPr(Ser) kinase/phosphatase [Caldisalinibacter kiritimatiensis]EOD00428.1 HPr kinase/phosphorylase [Caldisalinibacter kiritimatiensis]